MISRIRIPDEVIALLNEDEQKRSKSLTESLMNGGGSLDVYENLEFNTRTVLFEGPDELVRPLTAHVMGLIHKYN